MLRNPNETINMNETPEEKLHRIAKQNTLSREYLEATHEDTGTQGLGNVGKQEPIISPPGGLELTPKEAATALREAMQIIENVGTMGIYSKERVALAWLKKYFPLYFNKE